MENKRDNTNIKRGYLEKDFALFHIKDQINLELEFHYHDFAKIIVFISGDVTYLIEGKSYRLKPWDILLVNSSELHKPIIDISESYERIVFWINPSFLKQHNSENCMLETCFNIANNKNLNLLRLGPSQKTYIENLLLELEKECNCNSFGSKLLSNSLFLQLIININRAFLGITNYQLSINEDLTYDESISNIISYINENIADDLSIDKLAAQFFLNKHYLMHKFKRQTGYTLYNYILQKRLIKAKSLIKEGKSTGEACSESGFNDYSNFIRAFKKMFGAPPKTYLKSIVSFEKIVMEKENQTEILQTH
ncbi:AraC family transcriptional regulator [Alkaliphilus pronyensis]|uniref:AraC family transcriptional regulator n=1 Tax=Alkaliphilus pronyensis TaxID=1482732 RepID=A0A6I0F2R8_9FIRM|nr:AraC family transcriptional regulator [Alkaliphilus pronyensis]KAB3536317.1 AraC family transcriptional regulator [Alkaliphilus pronyensis]